MNVLKTDWALIEIEYRSGIKTLRQIATEHQISHGAITNRARRYLWERDLSAKIKAKAAALVSKSSVSSNVSNATEKKLVEANAILLADIQVSHRRDIPKKRKLVAKLFAEIEAQTDGDALMDALSAALKASDLPALARLAEKAASLPSRIKGVAELVSAYKSLIGLEREAFGLNDSGVSDPTAPDSISITFRRGSSEGQLGVMAAAKLYEK